MNILVTSAGRRVKIIEYFKRELESIGGIVIATDCDANAPALYFADKYEIVPRIDDSNYFTTLYNICDTYNVNAVISLIDPELELLAEKKEEFEKRSIQLILSPLELVQKTFDKFETFKLLKENAIPTVPTFNNLDDVRREIANKTIEFPLIIKPAKGSDSLGIYIIKNELELLEVFQKAEGQIIQPFYKDKEFGIDVYTDMINGHIVDLFIKEKIRMRAGETDKSISIHNEKIESLVQEMISKTNFVGPIDIDCFEYNGEYYISEINPRFGGGYPHAYEMGCNFMKYILNNLNGKANEIYKPYFYEPNIVMMKYDNILIRKNN